jgi:hypothetical protein
MLLPFLRQDIIGFGANFFNKKIKQNQAASEMKDASQGKIKPLVICGPSGAGRCDVHTCAIHYVLYTYYTL